MTRLRAPRPRRRVATAKRQAKMQERCFSSQVLLLLITYAFYTSPLFSGKDAMDWNARQRRRTLCFERRTAACTLRRMAEHGNTVNKKRDRPCGLSPSLDARRPRYWRKEEEAPGRANGEANGQCAERGLVGASNSLAKAPFARDRTSMTPSSARSQRSACSTYAR